MVVSVFAYTLFNLKYTTAMGCFVYLSDWRY